MGDTESLIEKVKQYIAERYATKVEVFDKTAEKRRNATPESQLPNLETALEAERASLEQQFSPSNWLTNAAKRAGQISMVTHAPKYTHSDTRSMGVFLRPTDEEDQESPALLHSLILTEHEIDVVGNAAALDVAGVLQQAVEGRSLLEEVAAGDSLTLKALASDEEQYQEWMQGFQDALKDKEVKTGQLAKQLYFPTDDGYHLVSPLYASSLSQKLHDRLTTNFYSDSTKAARAARKKSKYNPNDAITYPNIAVQNFGGANKQNVSQLNTRRNGRGYLLSARPPRWSKTKQLPIGGKHAFWRAYDRLAWKTASTLRSYLESISSRTSTIKRRDRRAELVDDLIETLLIFAADIQQQDHRGWSIESGLSFAEQLWLDPGRSIMDEAFKAEREKNDWQNDISRQFATWLNNKLSYKSKLLHTGDPEFREWNKLLERKLLLLKDDLGVEA